MENETLKKSPIVHYSNFSSAIKEIGLKEVVSNVNLSFDDIDYYFLSNDVKLQNRFNIPRTRNFNPLPNPLIVLEEYIAGLTPFLSVINEKTQDKVEDIFKTFLPSGYFAKIEGVVFPRHYSKNYVFDALGLNPSLSHPIIGIHIYDKDGKFFKKIELRYVDETEKNRINKINEVLQKRENERENYLNKLKSLYSVYNSDGLIERLIEEPKTPGQLASRRGISIIDLMEITLNYKNEQEFLSDNDFIKKLNLSDEQMRILEKRKLVYYGGKDISKESILPNETSIIERAIKLAQSRGENDEIINQLNTLLSTIEMGRTLYYHNIARGGIFKKPLKLANFKNGFFYYNKLLEIIIKNGYLKPRDNISYGKGTYFQIADYSLTDPLNTYGFVIFIMDPSERLKNIRTAPIILEIESSKMPQFKHPHTVVRYSPTNLPEELRRIIVFKKEDIKDVVQLLGSNGYQNVKVIDLESWKKEMEYLSEAREELMKE